MGKLLDLAKGIAGEKSLHGRVGRWILAVSTALDGGAATPDYGIAKKGPVLGQVGLGDTLPLELQGLVRGITYTPSSWILIPGKTYLLQADGWFTGFSDAVAGLVEVTWADGNGVPLQAGTINSPTARFRPATCTDPDSSGAGTLSMIYTVPFGDVNLRVARLYVLQATGTADMPSGSWTSTVTEIP